MWLITPESCHSSASAPASGCSISASDALCQALSRSVTWRGKPRQPASWKRACRTHPWLAHLSGLTCAASTDDDGLAGYLDSLRGSHASLTRSPASAGATQTTEAMERTALDPCPTSCGSWAKLDPPWSCSKTSQPGLWGDTSDQLARSYQDWVTRSRTRCSSLRRTLAQAIAENGSSSWPTPRTVTGGAESAERKKELGREKAGGGVLQAATQSWMSPRTATGDYTRDSGDPDKPRPTLEGQSKQWQTPNAANVETRKQVGDSERQPLLGGQAKQWNTPTASAHQQGMEGIHPGQVTLLGQAKKCTSGSAWPSPRASDYKGSDNNGHHVEHGYLTGAAERTFYQSSPPAPPTPAGQTSSPQRPDSLQHLIQAMQQTFAWLSDARCGDLVKAIEEVVDAPLIAVLTRLLEHLAKRRLNPRFTEWLMGWTLNWTVY